MLHLGRATSCTQAPFLLHRWSVSRWTACGESARVWTALARVGTMWLLSGKCTSKARLDGKTAVVTGCNTGIGKVTVQDFVQRGCRVIMACRDVTKAEAAAEEIRQETVGMEGIGEVVVVHMDLSSFSSIRKCAQHLLETESNIHLLINNAGVMVCPEGRTEDGFEIQIGTNHLGHFLLTILLLPRIIRSAPARIVTVSSVAHMGGRINFDDINSEKSYNPTWAYAQSKLANILFSSELARRLEGTGVTTYSLHPGVVNTDLGRHLDTAYCPGAKWLFNKILGLTIKTPLQGAQTSIHCAVEERLANETGLYYSDCKKSTPSAKARDTETAKRLWVESLKWVGMEGYDPIAAEDKPVEKLQP